VSMIFLKLKHLHYFGFFVYSNDYMVAARELHFIVLLWIKFVQPQKTQCWCWFTWLEWWRLCPMLILEECIHGGGTVTLAPRTRNGSKRIWQVILVLEAILF